MPKSTHKAPVTGYASLVHCAVVHYDRLHEKVQQAVSIFCQISMCSMYSFHQDDDDDEDEVDTLIEVDRRDPLAGLQVSVLLDLMGT